MPNPLITEAIEQLLRDYTNKSENIVVLHDEVEDFKKCLFQELQTAIDKSVEGERERILAMASDIADELVNSNVPVIHPGELGEHDPEEVWDVASNGTASAFYGMLEQRIEGSENGR